MALHVVAMPAAEFDAWVAAQATPATSRATESVQAGREAFAEHGCAACHAIDPTSDAPSLGPNLAHVSSRSHLGAGVLPNNRGTLMGWIGDAQSIKPNNRMPPYANLTATELEALALYLERQR